MIFSNSINIVESQLTWQTTTSREVALGEPASQAGSYLARAPLYLTEGSLPREWRSQRKRKEFVFQ